MVFKQLASTTPCSSYLSTILTISPAIPSAEPKPKPSPTELMQPPMQPEPSPLHVARFSDESSSLLYRSSDLPDACNSDGVFN